MLAELINIIFCAIIVFIGSLAFKKSKKMAALLITIAFGMFGLTYIVDLFSTTLAASKFFILITIIGYAAIIFVLYEIAYKKTGKITKAEEK
jgi:hypothetical protein